MKTRRPVPVADAQSAGFWEAAARHVLTIARCSVCGCFSHPPDIVCAHCGSVDPDFRFHPVSGNATVRSWTVVRQALLPGFDADVPYLIVDVELAEQADLRMTGRLMEGTGVLAASLVNGASVANGTLPAVGARVHVVFEDIADGVSIPAFRLGERV